MPVVLDWSLALGAQPSVLAFLVAIATRSETYVSAMALGWIAVWFERLLRLEHPIGVVEIGVEICAAAIAVVANVTVKVSWFVGALGAGLLGMSAVTAVPVALGAGCLGICWSLQVGAGLGRRAEDLFGRPGVEGKIEPAGWAMMSASGKPGKAAEEHLPGRDR